MQREPSVDISFGAAHAIEEAPMPPRAFPVGLIERTIKLGDADVSVRREP
ncbi:MAG: hypothetical protein IPP94_17405 [Ignavibacteria bacterium]|nr:hypothetical protein [Ignavibacteria bacterium]